MEVKIQKTLEETLAKLGRLVQEGKPISFEEFSQEDFNTLYTVAYGLYESGDYMPAKDIFHQLVLAKPLQSEYWFCMGSCLQMDKAYSEALSAWAMCALLDGHNPLPHYHAAECYLSLGEILEGKKALNLFLQMAKEDEQFSELVTQANTLLAQWEKSHES